MNRDKKGSGKGYAKDDGTRMWGFGEVLKS